ncbi:hypothetical protein SI65_08463 [Aspergillus cristatus]|uniref:Uncharacterized protein n=1 Tax=Aspergillus cristatus TaxID=573508 RepID=A0A1E3B528_ASPCR|nr:hypothetical protein SI65_08463 [Aspergillus cristatus]
MNDLSRDDHMARFGRPLWLVYRKPDKIARAKIIGSRFGEPYHPEDRDHAFAILSVRVCLDLNLANPITLPVSHSAVNVHMQKLSHFDSATGVMFTRAPVEPILSKAAMQHLCADPQNWNRSIKTFTSELLDHGVVEKWSKGELFSRLLFTMAHDCVAGAETGMFNINGLLRALLSQCHHKVLERINREILGAPMNFVGFTATKTDLKHDDPNNKYLFAESFNRLCYTLLRRVMALQLAPQRATYDQLLPFSYGDPNEPFDEEQVGAILVQVKYKQRATSPAIVLGETFYPYDKPFPRAAKILLILFDFGASDSAVDVSYSKNENPRIWAIHARDMVRAPEDSQIAFEHDQDLLENVFRHDTFVPPRNDDGNEEDDGRLRAN